MAYLALKSETAKAKIKKADENVQEILEQNQELTTDISNTAATVSEQSSTVLANFGLDPARPTWDLFIILFFVVGALLYGLSLGRDRIIVIMVSIFMALGVVEALPEFVLNVTFNDQPAFQLTTFISLFIILFFFISRSALMRTLGAELSSGSWFQTIIFSILHVGLLISIVMSFLPVEMLQKFTPLTQTIFTQEWARFGWIIAPIFAMVMFGSKKEE